MTKLKHLALVAFIPILASCSLTNPNLKPVVKPNQKIFYSMGHDGYQELRLYSKKPKSQVQIMCDTNPFMHDKQALFDISIANRSSKSVFIGENNVQCFVDGKEVKIYTKSEKLAYIDKRKVATERSAYGKKLLASIVSSLDNIHSTSTSYSGGTINTTYTNHAGVAADNRRYNNQIDSAKFRTKQYLNIEYQNAANYYFQPRSIRPKGRTRFLLSPKMKRSKSNILLKIKVGNEIHELKYELE